MGKGKFKKWARKQADKGGLVGLLFSDVKQAEHFTEIVDAMVKGEEVDIKEWAEDWKNIQKDMINSAKSEIKEKAKNLKEKIGKSKALHFAQKFNPVMIAARGAFRSILELNMFSITYALSLVEKTDKNKWDRLLQKWYVLGGEKGEFAKLVQKKKNRKPAFQKLADKFNKKRGFDGSYSNLDGESPTNVDKVVKGASGALASGATVLALAPEPTGATKAAAIWVGVGSAVLAAMSGILGGATGSPEEGITPPTDQEIEDALVLEQLRLEKEKKDKETTSIIVGVSALAIVIIGGYLILKKE